MKGRGHPLRIRGSDAYFNTTLNVETKIMIRESFIIKRKFIHDFEEVPFGANLSHYNHPRLNFNENYD